MTFHVPEKYRVKNGPYGTMAGVGNYGLFVIPHKKKSFTCICSDDPGWEHVSVSLPDRCPTWREMCDIKGMFWDDEDVVIQFHPAKSQYVNNHPYCLHLWRPTGISIPVPPSIMVGMLKRP